jgi:RND family efflux transporter MFP subunit
MPDEGAHMKLDQQHEPEPDSRKSREERRDRRPAPKSLKLFAIVIMIAAVTSAAYGILTRQDANASLATWTNQQAVPSVTVKNPDDSNADRHLVLPGDVQAFYEAPIFARVPGYLKSWSQDIGANVKAGQLLATIETPDLDEELAQAQADLATARANSNFADLTAKRWHALLSSNSVSVQSADEKEGNAAAEKATVNAQLAHVNRLQALESFKRLLAPFDGVVTARNTDVGALINAGSSGAVPLFKVADMHEMRVYVRVPQAYASQLVAGMKATLKQPQYPGVTFPATLATTSESVAADTRTVLVELMAPNPQGKLWSGTYAEVDFTLPADKNVLRVPSSALIFRSHGAQLATVTPDNKILMKTITIGRNLGNEIEITSGITAQDRVVSTPLDTIEDGETVQVMDGPKPDTPQAKAAG